LAKERPVGVHTHDTVSTAMSHSIRRPFWITILLLLIGAGAARNLWAGSAEPGAPADDEIGFAVFPDSQHIVSIRGANTNWLKDAADFVTTNASRWNMACALHVGDHTDFPGFLPGYVTASNLLSPLLDFPHLWGTGNHEYLVVSTNRRVCPSYEAVFGPHTLTNRSWWDGELFEPDAAENAFYTCTNRGHKYLFLSLEYAPRPEVMIWATNVIQTLPDHLTFLATHTFTDVDGMPLGIQSRYCPTNGEGLTPWQMWPYLAPCSNLVAIFSGHQLGSGVGRGILYNDFGNPVSHILFNVQNQGMTYGGTGNTNYAVRIYHYSPTLRRLVCRTYHVSWQRWLRENDNEFVITAGTDPANCIGTLRWPDYTTLGYGADGRQTNRWWTLGKTWENNSFELRYGVNFHDDPALISISTNGTLTVNGLLRPAEGLAAFTAVGTNRASESYLEVFGGAAHSHIAIKGNAQGTGISADWAISIDSNTVPALYIGGNTLTDAALRTNSYAWRMNWSQPGVPANTFRSPSPAPADYRTQVTLNIQGRPAQTGDLLNISSAGGVGDLLRVTANGDLIIAGNLLTAKAAKAPADHPVSPGTLAPASAVAVFGDAPATNVLFDASRASVFYYTLTNNVGLWLTNGSDGQIITLRLQQDAKGKRKAALVHNTGGAVTSFWRSGTELRNFALSTAPGKADYLRALYFAPDNCWDVIEIIHGY
jgi:hypothetical protein